MNKSSTSPTSRGRSRDRSTSPSIYLTDKEHAATRNKAAVTKAQTLQGERSSQASKRTSSQRNPSSTANKLLIIVTKPKKSDKRNPTAHQTSRMKDKSPRSARYSSKSRSPIGTIKVRAFDRRGRKRYICFGVVPLDTLKRLSSRHGSSSSFSKHTPNDPFAKLSCAPKKKRRSCCKSHKSHYERTSKQHDSRPRAPSKPCMRSHHEHHHSCHCPPHCPPSPDPECCVNHIKVVSRTETIFKEQHFPDVTLRSERVMPAQDTSIATVFTYAVVNRGVNDMIVTLEISPNGKDYMKDATERISAGSMGVIVPNRFLKWTRIRITPEGATTADIYYQYQTIGIAREDR